MITDHHIKALLLALGDDPALAIACINHLFPELLCFFLPESQKDTIESLVQPQITKMPQRWDWILTTDPESFVQSHQAITKNLPNILKTWGVQPGELVMDFSTATPAKDLIGGDDTLHLIILQRNIPSSKKKPTWVPD